MTAPATMAEAVHMIDMLQAELDKAFVTIGRLESRIDTLQAERDTWRAETGR